MAPPVPAPQPTVRASPSSQVSIGRVATRKVTLSDLRVLQAQDVSAPQTAAPKSSDSGGIKDYRVGLQLRAQDKVTPAQLEEGIGYAREYGVPLSEALVATAAVSDEDMVIAMGEAPTPRPSAASAWTSCPDRPRPWR